MPGRFRKAPVVISHKLISKFIGCIHRRNSPETELLYKAILKRQMGAFHTAFGRAGISADSLDIQLMHRTAKLGITIAAGGIFIVDSEDAGFVTVQCQWFAMLFQIAPGGFKIGEG